METNLKKLLAIVGVACLSITSVFAQPNDRGDRNAPMNQSMSRDDGMMMRDRGDDNGAAMMCPGKCAVPCGKYCPGECPVVFVSAAYTLWTAREAGLAVADSNYYEPPVDGPTRGCTWYPQWRLRSGFKVDVGIYLDHDCWDAVIEYTWFYNWNNRKHPISLNNACAPGKLYSTWSVCECPCDDGLVPPCVISDLTTVVLDCASRKWDNWLNRIDGQLGRTFYFGHFSTLRPFLGILGAWDEQRFNFDYTVACNGHQYEWRNQQKWWGVGPYGGFEPSFIFPPGDACNMWSIFLDSGLAMLWSHFQADQRLLLPIPSTNTTTAPSPCSPCDPCKPCKPCFNTQAWYQDCFWTITPMLELALGIRWETWMECDWYFLVQAAWETQCYFEHNHFRPMGYPQQGHGNLTLQGFTLKARFGF